MSKRIASQTVAFLFAICLLPSSLHAQSTPLSQILPVLLGNTITLQPSNLADQPNHVAHFQPGFDQLQVPARVNESVLTLLSSYPIGTPGGGFTYVFDPALGSLSRSSETFGPSFAERALTTGRGKVSVGFGYQRATYDTFEGLNLRQRGEGLNLRQRGIVFYVPHTDCCSPGTSLASTPDGSRLTPPFEGDLIEAALGLELVSDTSTIVATYGVSDRFDIGLAVPFVRVKLNASVLARIDRLATQAEPTTHEFTGANPDEHLFSLGGTAGGIGDIALRAKYRVPAGRLGIAGVVETRLPTGDEMNLLGTGGVQAKVMAIVSYDRGPISPHLNLGYTFSSEGALPNATMHDEALATVGADFAMTSRMTMSFDVLGRLVFDAGRMRLTEKTYPYALSGGGAGGGGGGGGGGGARPPTPVETLQTTRTELQFYSGNLDLYLGAAGLRFNPWRTILVSANLLFPFTKAGLRDRVTPTIGIDYVF
jgi:hypothetical protein